MIKTISSLRSVPSQPSFALSPVETPIHLLCVCTGNRIIWKTWIKWLHSKQQGVPYGKPVLLHVGCRVHQDAVRVSSSNTFSMVICTLKIWPYPGFCSCSSSFFGGYMCLAIAGDFWINSLCYSRTTKHSVSLAFWNHTKKKSLLVAILACVSLI